MAHHSSALLLGVALSILSFGNNASARDGMPSCEARCQELATEIREECQQRGRMDICPEVIAMGLKRCASGCNQPVVLPDRDGLRAIALGQAREIWGDDVQVYDEMEYLGADEKPASRLFVFFRGESAPPKQALMGRLAFGHEPTAFEHRFSCVEVGASLEMPPVVAFWDGLPLEYIQDARAQANLSERFGAQQAHVSRRFRSAVFPVFEYAEGDRTFYVDGRSGRAGDQLRLERNTETRLTERYVRRKDENRQRWSQKINALNLGR